MITTTPHNEDGELQTAPFQEQYDRVVRLYRDIDAEHTPPLLERLLSLDAASPIDPIHLYISSPGGCVISGFVLIDAIQHIRAPVWTYGIGLAASMAAILLVAGTRGRRFVLPHTRLLMHPASGAFQGRIDDISATVRLQRNLVSEVERFLLAQTCLSRSKIKQLLGRENYLDAPTALRLGLIDHILQPATARLEGERRL